MSETFSLRPLFLETSPFSVCLLPSAFFLPFTRTWARTHAQGLLEFLSSRLSSTALTWSPHRDGDEWWNPVKHPVIKSSVKRQVWDIRDRRPISNS